MRVYPEEARKEVTRPEDIRDIAIALRPAVMILCPFLKQYYPQISLPELAENLKYSLSKPSLAPSVDLVVETLRQSVLGVALEIKRSAGIDSPVIQETVGSLALFQILCQEEETKKLSEEAIKGIVADLAAYILVNQLLLHHILSQHLSFKKLESTSSPLELNRYFKEVLDIDYRAIFCVDVASNMPRTATPEINTAIRAMEALQPENLRHDLLGRIFHEFLPKDTRKQLGAFYTKPQAAEILAGLSIHNADDRVLDLACGSGTLLVAAYRKKSSIGKVRPHHKIVEEELTGVDIMPFAAHLAALNLTMQSPLEVTNKTRIGIGNSLHLAPGEEVGTLAQWMRAFGGDVTGIDVNQLSTKADAFKLESAHVVIMNPPFTRKEYLTPQMKGIRFSSLGEQNYWAYFVALATSVLRKNGRIAAVLPRDFFRGEYSKTIRGFLFKNKDYGIRYAVKSTKEWAFSEGAAFRDFLVVLQKDYSGKCAVVYLKKRLGAISLREAIGIPITIQLLEEGKIFEDEEILVLWHEQEEIWQNWHDLAHLVVFNTEAGEKLQGFYHEAVTRAGSKLVQLGQSRDPVISVLRGLEPTSEHMLNLVFIVRPIHQKRIERSKLILMKEAPDKIIAKQKDFGTCFDIPVRVLKKGLKTAAYLPQLDVSDISDVAILAPFDRFDEIQHRLGVERVDFQNLARRAAERFAYLVTARRFDFTATGTKALSFFSEDKLLPGKAFWSLSLDVKTAKALCLWFNSTLSLIELLLKQTETRGTFIELTEEKLLELQIPDFAKSDIGPLLEAFEKVRYEKLPPLAEQFDDPPLARQIIDQAVLRFIGYEEREIEALLPEIYHCLAKEMKSFVELMRRTTISKEMPVSQLHLIASE
jgi:SAM-dependent methyltransferase